MDKRSLMFVVLTFLVIIAYSYINAPQIKEQAENTQDVLEKPVPQETEAPVIAQHEDAMGILSSIQSVKSEPSRNKIYIETRLQSYIIDSDRASVISCQLKEYHLTAQNSSLVEMVSDESYTDGLFPLDLVFFDENVQDLFNSSAFAVESGADTRGLIRIESPRDLVFVKTAGEMTITKTIRFYPDRYGLDLLVKIEGPGEGIRYAVTAGPDILSQREEMKTKGRYTQPDDIIFRAGGKNRGLKAEKMETDFNILSKNTDFIALNDLYFVQAFIPVSRNSYPFFTSGQVIGYAFQDDHAELSLYIGPKSKTMLGKFDKNLSTLVDFGFFSIIASPLHMVINLFYGFIGNYGVAIILLTISIKLIFFPITFKSYLQMRRMTKLNPQMKEIRKKYKDQPQKLNQEIQALYKKHNVNPLSSCLPMFLQLPVLFALYRVLSIAIELRHQSFLWINDLAGPDPYLVLPILMSVAMFFQQKLTPTSADPKQAKMMAILMPGLFFIMFRNLQAGLVLYWFTSNLLIILEQTFINKAHLKEEQKA